jgi:hypothetical protein
MSTMVVTTGITHQHLMNKTKHELARMILDLLDDIEELKKKLKQNCKHSWEWDWLTEDLEGFRCKNCGKEVLNIETPY